MSPYPLQPLSELCTITSGTTPSKKEPRFWGGDLPWVSAKDLKGDIVLSTQLHLTTHAVDEANVKIAETDSLLVLVRGMGLAHGVQVAEVGIRCSFNQDIRALLPKPNVNRRYLLRALRWASSRNSKLIKSAAHGTLKVDADDLRSLLVPLPPLAEQKRIVAILDEAFEAIERAELTTQQTKINADALLRNVHDRLITDIARCADMVRLQDITTKIGSGSTPRGGKSAYIHSGIALVRSMNVYDRQFFSNRLAFITEQQADMLSSVTLTSHDVLLNITGASVARCCTSATVPLPARVNQHVLIIRPDVDRLVPEFLCAVLTSPSFKRVLLGIGEDAGSTRQAITKGQMQCFVVPTPSINRQRALCEQLKSVESSLYKLKAINDQKHVLMSDLRRQILKAAFAGELSARQLNHVGSCTSSFTDRHALVLALAYHAHQRIDNTQTFGHVKAEKIAHMTEAIGVVDLGRQPVKLAAGPADIGRFDRVREYAEANNYFRFVERKTGGTKGYRFERLPDFDKLVDQVSPHLDQTALKPVFDLLAPVKSSEAELLATAYAAWNNLLLDGAEPTDDDIVRAARDEWHEDKMKYAAAEFTAAIRKLRKAGLVPDGSARRVSDMPQGTLFGGSA